MCARALKRGGEPGGGPLDASIQILTPFGTFGAGYPADTVFRVRGTIPGFEPVAAGGQFLEPSLQASGDDFVIEAKAVSILRTEGGAGGPDTLRCTTSPGVAWGGIIAPASRGWAKGFTWSSNGHTVAMPQVRLVSDAPPQLYFDVTGCGDGDPATLDGFLAAFLPLAFLQKLGISEAQLAATNDSELSSLFAVTDNGTSASPVFAKATNPSGEKGVRLDYRLSFSRHEIAVEPAAIAPGKPKVKWSADRRQRTIRATVSLPATGSLTHAIAATKVGSKGARRGKCTPDRKKPVANCTIKLTRGTWRVSVTPTSKGIAGAANTRAFRF